MFTLVLILHLMLIAMGTGMSFSNVVNLRLARGQGGEAAKGLGLQRRAISRIGDGIIAFIWITGLVLAAMIGSAGLGGWFIAKLVFVVLLTASHFMARRTAGQIMRGGDSKLMPRLEIFVWGVWISALAAIAFAVIAFGT
jgi:uncharacterized membrane protein